MKINITNKTIVAVVGCLTVGVVTCILKNPDCLWGLVPLIWIVDKVDN